MKFLKRRKKLLILICVGAAAVAAYLVLVSLRSFSDFSISNYATRPDSDAAHLASVNGKMLSYSNDGAMYIDRTGNVVWNMSYEMSNPIEADRGEYMALANLEGTTVYIEDGDGDVNQIEVGMSIIKLDISENGVVGVIMKSGSDSFVAVYSKDGSQIAEGKLSAGDKGTPLDLAISPDGTLLCVAVVSVAEGSAGTTLYVYDFSGSASATTNAIAEFSYSGCVIPDVAFINDDNMVAFGDNGVNIFDMSGTPSKSAVLGVDTEIKGVFYCNKYFGLIFSDGEDENGRYTEVYNMKCRQITSIHTDISYGNAWFLDSGEICMIEGNRCAIYRTNGREKFSYEFDEDIKMVMSKPFIRGYTFVTETQIQNVFLKLF